MKISSQAKRLLKMFPKLTEEDARKIDKSIKCKIIDFSDSYKVEIIAKCLKEELNEKLNPSDQDQESTEEQCKQLAEMYIENDNKFIMQENLFCLLSFLVFVFDMMRKIVNNYKIEDTCELKENIVTIAVYCIVLIIQYIVYKFGFLTKSKFKLFLTCFNRYVSSFTVAGILLFYICYLFVGCKMVLFAILIAMIVIILAVSFEKYFEVKNNK